MSKMRGPIYEPLGRLALRHPVFFCLQGALIGSGYAGFLLRSPTAGVLWGAGLFVVMLALWMPPYGPLRRYVQRYIDDE